MPARIAWTDDMLAALRRLRAEGVPIYKCAIEIGVAYPTAAYKCRDLGLADRRNPGGAEVRVMRERIELLEFLLKRAMEHGVDGTASYHASKAYELGVEIRRALGIVA